MDESTLPQGIDKFLHELVVARGVAADERDAAAEELAPKLELFLLEQMSEHLTKADQTALNEFVRESKASVEQLPAFLRERVPATDSIVAAAMEEFGRKYLAGQL